MTGYAIPVSIPRNSRSSLRRPRRDLAITAADDFTLELTVYDSDGATVPTDVTGAVATWRVYDASGTAIVEVEGAIIDADAGRIDIEVPTEDTAEIVGRFSHSIRLDFDSGLSTIVHGVINIAPISGAFGNDTAVGTFVPTDDGPIVVGQLDVDELTVRSATVTQTLIASGTLAVAGAGTFSTTLGVTGAATFASTLDVAGTLTADGDIEVAGLTRTKNLNIAMGSYTVSGAYSTPEAPWTHSITVVAPADLSTAPVVSPRVLNNWAVNQDTVVVYTDSTRARHGSLISYNIGHRIGVANGAVASSWAGSRTLTKQSQLVVNHSREYSNPSAYGATSNAILNDWVDQSYSYSFGGTAPFTNHTRGRGQARYTRITLAGGTGLTGGSNLTSVTQLEAEYFFTGRSSVRRASGIRMSIAALAGTVPPEGFAAFTGARSTSETPGWSVFLQQGVDSRMGVDPYTGDFVAARASWTERIPRMRRGIDISDVTFGKEAIRWPGGHISGGERGVDGQGTLRVGTLYAKPTSTGVTLDAAGYVGRPVNYTFSGGALSGALNVTINRTAPLFEDDWGGLYRGVLSTDHRSLTSLITLIPPVADGSAGAPSTSVTVRMRDEFGAAVRFAVTGTASTTSIPTRLSVTTDNYFSDNGPWLLEFLTGACAGEIRAVTGYTASDGTLTTEAFSTSPTETINLVTNPNFSSAFPTAEDTIQNGWQWTNGAGTGTVTVTAGICSIAGDGTNAASLDQAITTISEAVYYLLVTHIGEFTLKVGTSRGGTEVLDTVVPYLDPDGEYVTTEIPLTAIGTTTHLRFSNTDITAITLDIVRCAGSTEALTTGVQAVLRVPSATITQVWTARSALSIQPTGGATTIGGTLTAPSLIPSGATVPTNGMYLPGANTLGWAVNSSAEMFLTASALSPAVSGGLGLGSTALPWAWLDLASGATFNFAASVVLTHSASLLTLTGGGLSLAGSGTGLAVTNNATIGGTLGVTGAAAAASYAIGASTILRTVGATGFALGVAAGSSTTGSNVLIGPGIAPTLTSGSNNIIIGTSSSTNVSSAAESNTIRISGGSTAAMLITATNTSTPPVTFAGAVGAPSFAATAGATTGTTLAVGTSATVATSLSVGTTLTIKPVSGVTSPSTIAHTYQHIIGADSASPGILIDAFDANGQINARRANGTSAAPTALSANQVAFRVAGRGYEGTTPGYTGQRAFVEFMAAETFTSTAQGMHVNFGTTATGASSNAVTVMRLHANGLLLIGTTTEDGTSSRLQVSGNSRVTGYRLRAVGNALTAAGTTRTDALQLAAEINRVTTAAAGTGLILPTGVVGMVITVFNAGANLVKVYANGSETIDGTAGSTGVSLSAAARCDYLFTVANTWISALRGAVSA